MKCRKQKLQAWDSIQGRQLNEELMNANDKLHKASIAIQMLNEML